LFYKIYDIIKSAFFLFQFRHVVLPKEAAKKLPKNRLLTEEEWKSVGVVQSNGWVHYMIHAPGKF